MLGVYRDQDMQVICTVEVSASQNSSIDWLTADSMKCN